MKRNKNNNFMLAYILFIIVCAFARFFVEYSAWGRLVAAITCSSWFFALADSNTADIGYMKEHVDNTTAYISSSKSYLEKMVAYIQNKVNQQKEVPEEMQSAEAVDAINQGESVLTDLKDLSSYFSEKEAQNEKDLCKIKKKEFWEGIDTILGFFAFFLIMTFDYVANIAIQLQDVLTVFAFASILMTQYFSTLHREMNAKRKAEFDEIVGRFEKTCSNLGKGRDYNAH